MKEIMDEKNSKKKFQGCVLGSRFFIHSSDSWKKSEGLTLIELLIVVSIMGILSTVSFLSIANYRGAQSVERTMDELESAIQSTQKKAVTQQEGKAWGIRLQNTTTTNTYTYSIFTGSSFVSSTSAFGLSRGVRFTNPTPSSTYDMAFQAVTGYLSEKKVISITNSRGDSLVGDLILSTLGKVTKRLENGLVGYWHLDEGTGTLAYDASGNGRNGTLTNSPTWQTSANCKAGGCISFDGVNEYVLAPGVLNLTSSFTVEAWAKTPIVQDASYDTIVSKFSSGPYNGWFLRRPTGASVVYFTLYNNGTGTASIPGPTIVADAWTHYAGTFDGTSVKFYINGVLVGTDASASVGSATTYFAIGGNYGGSMENWNGSIDEVRIYNRALSATEILNHYNDLK